MEVSFLFFEFCQTTFFTENGQCYFWKAIYCHILSLEKRTDLREGLSQWPKFNRIIWKSYQNYPVVCVCQSISTKVANNPQLPKTIHNHQQPIWSHLWLARKSEKRKSSNSCGGANFWKNCLAMLRSTLIKKILDSWWKTCAGIHIQQDS